MMTGSPINPNPATQSGTREYEVKPNIPLASAIVAIALALFVALPVIAVGAAVALRAFCWIAGAC